jgi:hypothetical protein
VVRISDTWLRRRTTVGGWVARHWSGRVLHSRERGRESEIGFLFVFVCVCMYVLELSRGFFSVRSSFVNTVF